MNNRNILRKIALKIFNSTGIIALCMSCGISYGDQGNIKNQNSNLTAIKFQTPPPPPPPPPNRGEPTGRSQGGAGRGCEPTAIVPATKSNNGNLLWGLTVSERPQFWFGLPRNLTTQDVVEFILTDDQGNKIYKTRLENINTPKGIVSFALPQQTPPLQIGKTYNWSFSIYCDFKLIEDIPGEVAGRIKRVPISTTLKNELADAKTPIDKANVYARNGVWFDAATILAINLRNKQQKEISLTWSELLKQVGLEQVVSLPITNCCTKAPASK